MNVAPRYLTEEEAAKLLKVSAYTLGRLRRKDIGPPYIRVGGQIRYIENTLHEWAMEQQHKKGVGNG